MARKIVLCRCEDVTLADLEHCVHRGYLDIEEVKRYTGFGTGPPGQGVPRAGRDAARAALRQAAVGDPAVHVAPAARAYADQAARNARRASLRGRSVSLGGGIEDDEEDESRADVSGEVRLPPTLESLRSPERAEVAIVGGGVMGLAIAYYLARAGMSDVVVLERGYLAEGASGRNGGGVRQQWATEINIRLMQESVELCRRFAVDLGVNVWFRQGGYLFLARSAKEVERVERNIALQNRCGVPTKMLDPREAKAIVPELDLAGIVGAAYNPSDGILFPWPFLWGYARQAAAYGVRIFTQTPVQGITPEADGGYTIATTRQRARGASSTRPVRGRLRSRR